MSGGILPGLASRENGLEATDGDPGTPPLERTLGQVAAVLWKRRTLVIRSALAAAVAAALLSLALPPTYEAVTTVIPVPEQRSTGGLEVTSARLEGLGLLTSAGSMRFMIYPDIARSRELLERILVMRFPAGRQTRPVQLMDILQPRGRGALRQELAVRKLRRQVDAVVDRRTGLLTIRVRARAPGVAAGVANALVALLQEFSVRTMAGNATENRRFIEGRLAETRVDLARSEGALRAFRESNLRIGNSPRLQLELSRRVRDTQAQEEIFLALTRQYELARLDEHRDVPVLNVLDPARAPASRSAPRRGMMTMMGFVLGVALGGAVALGQSRPGP